MVEWPSPQSSVQTIAYSPTRFGVITSVVSTPGTASDFWPNSGTQNAWITSSERSVSLTASLTGSTSWPDVTFRSPGYSNFHANCCAVTAILIGCGPASSFLASTIALTTEIAVTSTAGIAVQTISRPVWPWIGGPSVSSSGCTRNLRIEYMIAAATTAKTAMQMTVVNQNVNSIRSISSDAEVGSHGTRTATTDARTPATTP